MYRIMYSPNKATRQSMYARGVINDTYPYTTTTWDGLRTYDEALEILVNRCIGSDPTPEVRRQYRIEEYNPESGNVFPTKNTLSKDLKNLAVKFHDPNKGRTLA